MRLDFRAAFRSITRTPGFFLSAVLTLGLGLGAVVTSFGLLAGALGASGAASAGDPVVLYLTEYSAGRRQQMRWPYAGVQYLRSAAQSYQHLATYSIGAQNLSGADQSARVDIEFVSPEYFNVVATAPVLGLYSAVESDGNTGISGRDRSWTRDLATSLWRIRGGGWTDHHPFA